MLGSEDADKDEDKDQNQDQGQRGGADTNAEKGYEYDGDVFEQSNYDFCKPLTVVGGLLEFDPFGLLPTQQEKEQLEDAWLLLARFIGSLPRLQDLVYTCTHQIPPCVLSVLHEKSPETRLHMHTFSLRSLYQNRDAQHDIDPDEYALVTSPNLHSIIVKWSHFDPRGRVGFNYEAAMEMASLTSRLKSVAMLHVPTDTADPFNLPLLQLVRKPLWNGFHGEDRSLPDIKGHLETLVCREEDISFWSNYTDFNDLRTLKLSDSASVGTIRELKEIAQNKGLQSLRSLALNLDSDTLEDDPDEQDTDVDREAEALLRSLNPLHALYLNNIASPETFDAIIEAHSESLTQLLLTPYRSSLMEREPFIISYDFIQDLVRKCTHLESLEIMVTRSEEGDDIDEITIYLALGRLPRLKHLALLLDCSTFFSSTGPYNSQQPKVTLTEGVEVPAAIVRETLVKCAVDLYLGVSIFDMIRAQGSAIEYLELEVGEACDFGFDEELDDIVQWIGRSCICRRDHQGSLVVRELRKDSRFAQCQTLENDFCGRDDIRKVWEEIWPGPAGDRRDQWRSLPLTLASRNILYEVEEAGVTGTAEEA